MLFAAVTAAASSLLAAVGPSDHPYLVYIAIGGAYAAVGIFNAVTGAILNLRRLKEKGAEANYVTQVELRAVHARVDTIIGDVGKLHGEVATQLGGLTATINRDFKEVSQQLSGIQRSLGQVEGLRDRLDEHSRDIDELQRKHRS